MRACSSKSSWVARANSRTCPLGASPIFGRALESLNLLFLEEPVAPDNLDGWRLVRNKLALPLAAGERLGTLHPELWRQWLDHQADFALPGGESPGETRWTLDLSGFTPFTTPITDAPG